jgi:hypothetical protein
MRMNGPMWLGWAVVCVTAVLSIVLIMGKGSSLIAGYNTASNQEKEKYDRKKLGYVSGFGLGLITIIMMISLSYRFELPLSIQWLMPWGYLVTIAVIAVLGNTVCRKK